MTSSSSLLAHSWSHKGYIFVAHNSVYDFKYQYQVTFYWFRMLSWNCRWNINSTYLAPFFLLGADWAVLAQEPAPTPEQPSIEMYRVWLNFPTLRCSRVIPSWKMRTTTTTTTTTKPIRVELSIFFNSWDHHQGKPYKDQSIS